MKMILLFFCTNLFFLFFVVQVHAQGLSSNHAEEIKASSLEPVIVNVVSKPSSSGMIHLSMNTTIEKEIMIEVYDMAEDKISSQQLELQEGDNLSSVDIQALEPGHYRISVMSEEEIYSKAFVKLWK